jgi:hypothetical protein
LSSSPRRFSANPAPLTLPSPPSLGERGGGGERIDLSEDDAKSLVAQQLAVPVTDDLITPAVSKARESKDGHR